MSQPPPKDVNKMPPCGENTATTYTFSEYYRNITENI